MVIKLTDLKLKKCLEFKADEQRSGCMQAEENAESVAIFRFQACCPLYPEGNNKKEPSYKFSLVNHGSYIAI